MTHLVVVTYDAPSDEEFEAWMHGPHYDEVLATPGVQSVKRYIIEDESGPTGRYLALIETNDLAATSAWRDSPAGQRSQQEANRRGVSKRAGFQCRQIFSNQKRDLFHE
jgi:hypothetical protein